MLNAWTGHPSTLRFCNVVGWAGFPAHAFSIRLHTNVGWAGFPAHAFSIRLHTNTVHATPHGAACTCIA